MSVRTYTQSGACIEVDWHTAIKTGPGVRKQAEYILALRNAGVTCVPTLLEVRRDGYVMPLYRDGDGFNLLPSQTVAPTPIAHAQNRYIDLAFATAQTLSGDVWPRSPEALGEYSAATAFSADAYDEKLARVTRHPDARLFTQVISGCNRLRDSVDFDALRLGVTHGDPTAENTVFGGKIVLDPIPPSGAVPLFPACDMGKVLQSIVGYEVFKNGYQFKRRIALRAARKFLDSVPKDDNEAAAAVFFCVLAFIRAVPYYKRSQMHLLIGATNALQL